MANIAIQAGISLAISYLSSEFFAPDEGDNPLKDSKATPLAERNSPISFLLGRARVAPVMLWAGDRQVIKEKSSVGKGTSDDIETDIWYEGGWHGLCLGPAYRLHQITQNGKVIKKQVLTAESSPSGSSTKAGKEGDFRMYWGNVDQPVSTYLGNQIGISSRWPFLCYVEWDQKRLGAAPVWPRPAYELEVRPHNPQLVGSSPWIKTDRTLTGDSFDVVLSASNVGGPGGVNRIIIDGGKKARKRLQAGYYCLIQGNATIPDGDYLILDCIKFGSSGSQNQLFIQSTIAAATSGQGTVESYGEDEDDGINAAHAIYQMLFEPYPHGRGLDVTLFDIPSLEEIGVLMEVEGIRTVVFSPNADTLDRLLGQLLQDIGIVVGLDPRTGLYRFTALRNSPNISVLPEMALSGPPIEYSRLHLDLKSTTRVLFTFKDRNRDFATMSISIDDDGIASLSGGMQGADIVNMPTVGDFDSASVVSLRRNQERVTGKQPYKIKGVRESRLLMPGQLFTVPGIVDTLICMENARKRPGDAESSITALPLFYGDVSTAVLMDGGGLEPDIEEAEDALAIITLEIPETLLPADNNVRLGVANVRAHNQTIRADIHLSADDITFFKISEESGVHIGGTFNADIAAEDVGLGTDGFEFTELGPDIASVLDLTPAGQRTEWRRGRQMILTQSGEIMFLRGVTALGGDQWRAEQVLRGRLDSVRSAHLAGENFIILADDQLSTFTDILLQPGDTVFLKVQPQASDSLPLDEIDSFPFTIYGKGMRPLPVRNLRAAGTDNREEYGNDLLINWGYLTNTAPMTGAGEQGAGTAIPVKSPPGSSFTLRVLDGATERRKVTGITDPFYNYSWADIAADFSYPSGWSFDRDWDIEVTYVNGSLVSTVSLITIFWSGVAP